MVSTGPLMMCAYELARARVALSLYPRGCRTDRGDRHEFQEAPGSEWQKPKLQAFALKTAYNTARLKNGI